MGLADWRIDGMIKCPNCEADMEIGGVCPECGYDDHGHEDTDAPQANP